MAGRSLTSDRSCSACEALTISTCEFVACFESENSFRFDHLVKMSTDCVVASKHDPEMILTSQHMEILQSALYYSLSLIFYMVNINGEVLMYQRTSRPHISE